MKRVCPSLRDVVDYATHVASVLSVEVLNALQFRDKILVSKENRRPADGVVIVVLPGQLKIVRARALTVDRQLRTVVVAKRTTPCRGYTRSEQHERVIGVAQWNAGDLFGIEGLGNLVARALDKGSSAFNRHCFCGAAELETYG